MNPGAWIATADAGSAEPFGPLVAAAVLCSQTAEHVRALALPESSERVRSIRAAFVYRVVEIGPARYNELIEAGTSPRRLRDWAHARAIERLYGLGAYPDTVLLPYDLDAGYIRWRLRKRFPDRTLEVRASESALAFEAAGVIAVDHYRKWISRVSFKLKVRLPTGSSEDRAMREVAARFEAKHLRELAKLPVSGSARRSPVASG